MSEEKLTMDDFSAELEASFKKIEEGDMLTGTVISVDEKEVILDLKYYAEGVIRAEDFSNEPGFSLKDAVQVGDEITATVIRKDDGHGNILLSRAEANDILAWEKLAQYKEEKTVLDVKVKGIVNAGVIAYVEGIRGFIPASKLSLNYVEDLNEYLNKDIQVQVFDLDKEKDRLILSAREILREKADEERKEKISNVEVGLVTEGTVESLQPYGAFINLGNGLSGLVHISQICAKRIKHPSAVLAVGDKVKVKLIRNKKEKTVEVTLKNEQGTTKIVKDAGMEILGAAFKELPDDLKKQLNLGYGLQVTGVSSGKMSDAGVRKGFIILKANDQPMRKVSDLEEVMKAAVKSPNQVLFLTGVFPSGKRGYFAVDLTQE